MGKNNYYCEQDKTEIVRLINIICVCVWKIDFTISSNIVNQKKIANDLLCISRMLEFDVFCANIAFDYDCSSVEFLFITFASILNNLGER